MTKEIRASSSQSLYNIPKNWVRRFSKSLRNHLENFEDLLEESPS